MFILMIILLVFFVVGITNSILCEIESLTISEIIIWNLALIMALLSANLYKSLETRNTVVQ